MSTLQGVNVLVSLIDPEMVVHDAHPECPTTEPHRIPECGLFSKEEVVTVDVDALVQMQQHRDAWREYAYGNREKPTDFLDGNKVNRPPTALEREKP